MGLRTVLAAVLVAALTVGAAASSSSESASSVAASSGPVVRACDPQRCINDTLALVVNATAYFKWRQCLQAAGDVRAFQCRCTPYIYQCLAAPDGGSCGKEESKRTCFLHVIDQGRGCSQKLCRSSAATLTGTHPGFIAALGILLATIFLA